MYMIPIFGEGIYLCEVVLNLTKGEAFVSLELSTHLLPEHNF